MAQIEQVVKQIQSEFRLDGNGQAFVSIRGAARLADIDPTGLSKSLVSGVDENKRPLAAFLISEGFKGVDLKAWSESGIPDIALALILEYYAYEAQERYRTPQAKLCCRAFNSIGIRSWIHKNLKWEKADNTLALPVQTAIAEAEIIAGWLEQNLGIDRK